jgi:hypothetical protein
LSAPQALPLQSGWHWHCVPSQYWPAGHEPLQCPPQPSETPQAGLVPQLGVQQVFVPGSQVWPFPHWQLLPQPSETPHTPAAQVGVQQAFM